jgi:non-heme chloroperoxidase
MRNILTLLILFLMSGASIAATVSNQFFSSRDGLRLHYLEAGSAQKTIVFIPGWLMPAAVFRLQLEALGDEFRVLAFDPRSQGKSEIFQGEHSIARRMNDMEDFLRAAGVTDYVLAGWSLGGLESLNFIERKPQAGLRGLIIIDNSIGEGTAPPARSDKFFADLENPQRRKQYLTNFSLGIFKNNAPQDIAAAALSSALQVPGQAAIQLISQPYPRTYWRDIVARQQVPVLYAIRPHLREQGDALQRRKGTLAQVEVFTVGGHALFVDEPALFNTMTAAFARRSFISAPGQVPARLPGPAAGGGQSAASASRTSSGN